MTRITLSARQSCDTQPDGISRRIVRAKPLLLFNIFGRMASREDASETEAPVKHGNVRRAAGRRSAMSQLRLNAFRSSFYTNATSTT